jgi:hypothetical protein
MFHFPQSSFEYGPHQSGGLGSAELEPCGESRFIGVSRTFDELDAKPQKRGCRTPGTWASSTTRPT